MKKIEYVLMRAVPDVIRGEQINVGIVAFFGEDARVIVAAEPWRLRALHPNLGDIDLAVWAADLERELALIPSKDAKLFLLSVIGGGIVAADQSYIVANSPEDVDALIDGLLKRLVVAPPRTFRATEKSEGLPRSKLHSQLRAWFRSSRIFSPNMSGLSKGKVVPSYPIVPDEDLYADFALKNGSIHVIETLDLRNVDRLTKSLRGEVGWKSILLDQARKTLPSDAKRIAVVTADDYAIVRPLIGMVERYADDLISMESATDRQRLADFVSRSLHLDESLGDSFNWV